MLSRRAFLQACGGAPLAGAIAGISGCYREPDDGRIHLRYMAWGNPEQHATEQEIIDRFHEQNDDVRVKLFKVPNSAYRNKMIVMLASRTAPDVIRVDQYDFPKLVRRNYFRELTEFVERDSDFDLKDFIPQALDECHYNERLFGLNTLFGGILIYYNRSLIERAGLYDLYDLYDKGDWTWEALREYAIKLTKTGPGGRQTQFGFAIPGFVSHSPMLWNYGAEILSSDHRDCLLDSAEAIRAYRLLLGLRWKDKACPTPSEAAQSAFVLESGKLGMSVGWMGETPKLRRVVRSFDWDVCPLPAGPAGHWNVVKGNQLVMSANTRHPEAAWRFMRHFVGRESEMYLCGRLRRASATRLSVMRDPEFLKADGPPRHTRAFLDGLENARRLPIDHRWQEWTTVQTQYMDRLYNYPEDPADVLPKMARAIERVLRSEEGF